MKEEKSTSYRFGFVSILGRANVGKSTLLNKFVGQSVSIVSNKPQTTRQNIKGILNAPDFQAVFIDSPGIHLPKNELQNRMVGYAHQSFQGVDLILYLTTIIKEEPLQLSPLDEQMIKKISPKKTIVVINKIDLAKEEQIYKTIDFWSKKFPAKEFIPISALKDYKVEKLKSLIKKYLPVQNAHYPTDWVVDSNFHFIAAEFVREQIFRILMQEIPYGVVTETEKIEQKENLKIFVCIYIAKKRHKKIIIGKNGEILKKIGTRARIKLEYFCKKKIFLSLYVKQRENWQNETSFLNEMGI